MKNNKDLSQNWLNDDASLQAMVQAGGVTRHDVVLEVGPGPGTLTEKLTHSAKNVVAVEFDRALAENLHVVVKASNLEVIHHDILTFDETKMPAGYKVVANIPYHITAKIIKKFVTSSHKPKLLALLVQKEVAERVAAQPGAMSLLSVSVQLFAETETKEVVPKELFTPAPKVDSQILVIRLLDTPRFDIDEKVFFKLVKAGFGERRKKLSNSLAGGLHISKHDALELLHRSDIDIEVRAQELSLDQWYTLYSNYVEL